MIRKFIPLFILLTAGSLCFAQQSGIQPNKEMLAEPVEFTGPTGYHLDVSEIDEIRIGLFAPAQDHPVGESMTRGVQLAVEQANAGGGYMGIPFKVVQRWSGNPWGDGAKDLIRLAYQDSVLAIIGSIDGTTTHLAEQIATKARIPLLAPVSSDPTLTYIRLPWIYRLPPEDELQIREIIDAIKKSEESGRIGVISSVSHDCRVFTDELLPALHKANLNPLFFFELEQNQRDYSKIMQKITQFDPQILIVDLKADEFVPFTMGLKEHQQQMDLYTPWIPALQSVKNDMDYPGDMFHIVPFTMNSPEYNQFQQDYFDQYQTEPDYAAAYSYDAARLIIESIERTNSLNRVHLQRQLSANRGFEGVTGFIKWDNGGGNDSSKPELTSAN
ncbi:MAG: ABC transporter substrate-binding protein [Candidatus Marinimicrobia bacterium]|nr:ABC transporter substrate-binding protein [Candidatus Neomarinimicrobiota bacterium]